MNYTQLTQAIIDWQESTEASLETHIPDFVGQAEKRVYNAVPVLTTRKNDTGVCTAGSQYLTVPTDWLATYSLGYVNPITNNTIWLLQKEPDFMREAYPNPATAGAPVHYAHFDFQTFVLGPTPDQSYAMECNYFGYPTSIVTAGTTWLGDNFPNVLLYGSLVECYTFQKGEQELIQQYEKLFQDSLAELRVHTEGKLTQDRYRHSQTRVKIP